VNQANGALLRYILPDGTERAVHDPSTLREAIVLGAVRPDTLVFSSASDRWMVATADPTFQGAIADAAASIASQDAAVQRSPQEPLDVVQALAAGPAWGRIVAASCAILAMFGHLLAARVLEGNVSSALGYGLGQIITLYILGLVLGRFVPSRMRMIPLALGGGIAFLLGAHRLAAAIDFKTQGTAALSAIAAEKEQPGSVPIAAGDTANLRGIMIHFMHATHETDERIARAKASFKKLPYDVAINSGHTRAQFRAHIVETQDALDEQMTGFRMAKAVAMARLQRLADRNSHVEGFVTTFKESSDSTELLLRAYIDADDVALTLMDSMVVYVEEHAASVSDSRPLFSETAEVDSYNGLLHRAQAAIVEERVARDRFEGYRKD
jgi:hypothetical protein